MAESFSLTIYFANFLFKPVLFPTNDFGISPKTVPVTLRQFFFRLEFPSIYFYIQCPQAYPQDHLYKAKFHRVYSHNPQLLFRLSTKIIQNKVIVMPVKNNTYPHIHNDIDISHKMCHNSEGTFCFLYEVTKPKKGTSTQ